MKLMVAILFSLVSFTSFATNEIICKTSTRTFKIGITPKFITSKEIGKNAKSETWRNDNPGIYSYFGANTKGPSSGNSPDVDFIRLDIQEGKKLSRLPVGKSFKMAIAFIWWDTEFDVSEYYLNEMFTCTKLK